METVEKKIGNHIVSMTPIGFPRNIKLKFGLLKPILDSVNGVLESDFTSLSGISKMFDYLSDEKVDELTRLILRRCTINGNDMSKEEYWDDYFSTDLTFFYQVVGFWVEVNYGDFLKLIQRGLEKAKPVLDKVTKSKGSSLTTMSNFLKS